MTQQFTPTTSFAIRNQFSPYVNSHTDMHMIYSILPTQHKLYQPIQFKKSKDFYRPGQCIWNNPHRTSPRLLKYYHQANQTYKKIKQPLIKQQQNQQRQMRQLNRIIRLTKKKQQTRERFCSRKLKRLELEQKSGCFSKVMDSQHQLTRTKSHVNSLQRVVDQNQRASFYKKPNNQIKIKKIKLKTQCKQNHTQNDFNNKKNRQWMKDIINCTQQTNQLRRSTSQSSFQPSKPILTQINLNQLKNTQSSKSKLLYKKTKVSSFNQLKQSYSNLPHNHKTFLDSINKYDMKKQSVNQLLKKSNEQMRRKIRNQFVRQKENNFQKYGGKGLLGA